MNISLEMEAWVINDEYFITQESYNYAVYICGTDKEDAKEVYSNESFEECLVWVWEQYYAVKL